MFKHNLTPVLNSQRPDKNGRYPLRIRACIKRKLSYYSTGVNLKLNQWDILEKKVVNHPSKTHLNLLISTKMTELENEFIEQHLAGNQVQTISKNKHTDFIKYCEHCIKHSEKRDSPETTRQKISCLKKFREFQSQVPLGQVTPQLLYKFEDYCRDLGNTENTVWKSIKNIKHWILKGVTDGVFRSNPLDKYKRVKYTNPERIYLTDQELDRIEKFIAGDIDQALKNAGNWFLFCCYSGLRYGDAAAFDMSKIVNGKIILRTGKTGSDVSIKVHTKLKEAIDRLDGTITTNQDYNRILKLIAAGAKIKKTITSHTARHTFAVMYLNRGGSMEVLSKLLGHANLKATSIYAKITDKRIDAEVDRVFD